MRAEFVEVSFDCLGLHGELRDVVVAIIILEDEGTTESCEVDVEAYVMELFQLCHDQLHVPFGLVEFVVGETVGFDLFFWEVEFEHGHYVEAQLVSRKVSSVSDDDDACLIDDDGLVEAELLDGAHDCLHLVVAVTLGVLAIRLYLGEWSLGHLHRFILPLAPLRS